MLTITVGAVEHYSDELGFHYRGGVPLQLEHSLASLSKWEAIYEKPFLGENEKTDEEIQGYIECMIMSPVVPPNVLEMLSQENYEQINAYINKKHTATWFNENGKGPSSREVITSELIYFWMMSAGIAIECENWHLNRLLTVIKIHGVKNSKPKKMSKSQMLSERRALNAARREQYNTTG